MANFSSILDKPFGDVKFPKLPVGSYVSVVQGMPKFDKSTKKGTLFVEFQLKLLEAMNDVDPDELEEFGGLQDKQLPITFYYETEGGYKRLVKFLENCGIDISEAGTVSAAIEQAPGNTIIAEVKHTPSSDGTTVYAQVDGTAKYGE